MEDVFVIAAYSVIDIFIYWKEIEGLHDGISPHVWFVCHFKDTVVLLTLTSVIALEASSKCSYW